MKNIVKYFAVAGAGCLMMTSCDNDEYLTTTHYDILSIDSQFEGDENALLGLNGIYTFNNVSEFDNSWGYKPNMFTGSHPTMDTQCTGWDVKFLDQTWDANVGELGEGWSHAYAAISRANLYLAGLEKAEQVSKECRNTCEGEARALRGYFYTWLATTFGRVPMLATGEDFSNTPVKASAETYEEMWDFIIEDFSKAAELLSWYPYASTGNGPDYGRCTKGMALAYLGDAYMWKAYRCPDKAAACYDNAIKAFEQIMTQVGTVYELSSNFSTNWDPAGFWNKECIWAMVSDEGNEWSSWAGDRTITFCNPNMFKWFTACPENGGWGAQYLSWEWYACYEPGDQRRDASCVTGAVPVKQMEEYKIQPSANVWGYNPYLQDSVGVKDENQHVVKPFINNEGVLSGTKTMQFHFTNGEFAPAIWTAKWWRTSYADGNSWGTAMWAPNIVYGKRLPNVMLDLAECYFLTNKEGDGWNLINTLRNRAWGNLEVGQDYSRFLGHYNNMYAGVGNGKKLTEYPLPVNTVEVPVPDAKTYYEGLTKKANRVGYVHTSPAWKVAVNEERRKEFNSEWCLCPDMIKSGYIQDHIDYNYPKDDGGSDYANYPWTKRTFDFDVKKMDMPIPATEILKNSAIKQNPGY